MPGNDDINDRLKKDWEFIRRAEEWMRKLGWREDVPPGKNEEKRTDETDEKKERPPRPK